jgi:hydrogenase maturation protease
MNSDSKPPRVVIVGYGDPARGDDGIGFLTAQKLGERFRGEPRVAAVAVQQLSREIVDSLADAGLAIFIESARGQRPGHLSCTFITPASGSNASSQPMDAARLLALAREASSRSPQAMLFTVAGEEFGPRAVLSRTVDRACQRLIDQVYRIVVDELQHPSSPL